MSKPKCQGVPEGKPCRSTGEVKLVFFYGDKELYNSLYLETTTVRVWLCKLCRQGRK